MTHFSNFSSPDVMSVMKILKFMLNVDVDINELWGSSALWTNDSTLAEVDDDDDIRIRNDANIIKMTKYCSNEKTPIF